MKRHQRIVLLIVFIISVTLPLYPDPWHNKADDYWLQGENLKKEKRFSEAAEMYRRSAEAEKKSGSPRKADLQAELGFTAMMYEWSGKYHKAVPFYKEALELNRELNNTENIITLLNNLGLMYYHLSSYQEALKCYDEVQVMLKKLGKPEDPVIYNNTALVYKARGKYRKALEYFNRALRLDKLSGKKGDVAIRFNNIGRVYHAWGSYDKALRYYLDALKIEEELKRTEKIAIRLNNIGLVYFDWKRFQESLEYFKRSLKINRSLGKKGDIARDLNNIGLVNNQWGRNRDALKYLEEALAINREMGLKGDAATNLNNLGLVYFSLGNHKKAIQIYKEAVETEKALGRVDDIARIYNNIGAIYHDLKDYKNAIASLNMSIRIKEKQRLTATGRMRLDYLASQLSTYGYLISAFIRAGEPDKSFDIIELSKAKYLAEQLGEKTADRAGDFRGISSYQKTLERDRAILSYANVNEFQELVNIAVTRNRIRGVETDRNRFAGELYSLYEKDIGRELSELRGLKVKEKKNRQIKGMKKNEKLEKIINFYRYLLSRENPGKEEIGMMKKISAALYSFLIRPVEDLIREKKTLVIIPDGILGFVPFETLVMDDGRFLIEKYHIRYTQSLKVSELINRRKYGRERKPFLAFGGAVYEESTYGADMVESEDELEDLKDEIFTAIKRGESTEKGYSSLGFSRWGNLPGTLAEVKALRLIDKEAVIYTGKDVNEESIKRMSRTGELKKYRVIHFATHGIVVPEFPELSAVILSLSGKKEGKEDGYLRMNEISGLDLNADFVNLSACETGLGKIYGGEGIVGLTHSFIISGANGLSVSLWQVSDESTMKFMTGLYTLVKKRGMSYSRAMTEIKRKFIKGDGGYSGYRSPFYWASFVYYGI